MNTRAVLLDLELLPFAGDVCTHQLLVIIAVASADALVWKEKEEENEKEKSVNLCVLPPEIPFHDYWVSRVFNFVSPQCFFRLSTEVSECRHKIYSAFEFVEYIDKSAF